MGDLSFDISLGFEDFTLGVEARVALHGITALFGPSGSGKSTLLRVLAGLESQAEGTITFEGEDWQRSDERIFVPPHKRGAGFVFQDARLFPHLSVCGNLVFAERRAPPGKSGINMDAVIEALDLAPLLSRRPGSLSGGERQRVAMGRTLLSRPRLLLMDEPLAALDLKRKAEILPYIEKLPGTFGVPVIYVSHAIDEVAQLALRMVVLSNGAKIAEGGVSDVLERLDLPEAAGRFEAGVVLTAKVLCHDTGYHLTTLEHKGQKLVMPLANLAAGAEARLRIRARDVALATQRPEEISVRNILSGTVQEIRAEAETAHAEVLVDIGGAGLRARLTRASVAELGLQPGTPVFALVKSISFDRRMLAGGREAP